MTDPPRRAAGGFPRRWGFYENVIEGNAIQTKDVGYEIFENQTLE